MPQTPKQDSTQFVEHHGKKTTVAGVYKTEDGTVGMTIETTKQGSNVHTMRNIHVTADDHVYYVDVKQTEHPEQDKASLQSWPTTRGSMGDAVDHALAKEIRDAYQGFITHDVTDAKEVRVVSDFVDDEFKKVPKLIQFSGSRKDQNGPSH